MRIARGHRRSGGRWRLGRARAPRRRTAWRRTPWRRENVSRETSVRAFRWAMRHRSAQGSAVSGGHRGFALRLGLPPASLPRRRCLAASVPSLRREGVSRETSVRVFLKGTNVSRETPCARWAGKTPCHVRRRWRAGWDKRMFHVKHSARRRCVARAPGRRCSSRPSAARVLARASAALASCGRPRMAREPRRPRRCAGVPPV